MNKGFTLLEMVLAIIVTSVLALGMADLAGVGTRGYFQSIDRYRVQNEARFVLEKLSREVRHAVPNLFSSTNTANCISFFPIIDGGFYAISGADLSFVVSDYDRVNKQSGALSIVINPTQPYENIHNIDNTFDLADATTSGGVYTIANAARLLVGGSVGQRHYVFNKSGEVQYCVNGSLILRNSVVVSDRLIPSSENSLNYSAATVQRNGLVDMTLVFGINGEQTQYEQEVQVTNVP